MPTAKIDQRARAREAWKILCNRAKGGNRNKAVITYGKLADQMNCSALFFLDTV